ncbi:zinc-finger-containing protein [Cytobacillus horneckiae]|uniref:zinc-finger-containing protein n=1 Tax=Cytobacillus horneckiae TaxID=549687 RepID=UPI0039A0EE55
MEAPKNCPYCNHPVVLTSNKEIYGRSYGNGRCYLCRNCRASVGVHGGPKGKTPLGIMATSQMKVLKQCCHGLFDPIWKTKRVSRGELYKRLSILLDIDTKDCHFGHFETSRLLQAIEIMSNPFWWREVIKQ